MEEASTPFPRPILLVQDGVKPGVEFDSWNFHDDDNAVQRHARPRALFFIHTSLAREFIHPRARVHATACASASARGGREGGGRRKERTYVREKRES